MKLDKIHFSQTVCPVDKDFVIGFSYGQKMQVLNKMNQNGGKLAA